jgi:hypothetical protein
MPAPKGNSFWKARSKHGRDKIFTDKDILWDACVEYFQYVEENPLLEGKATQYQGEQVDMTVHKMHAMTQAGLCLFLDISQDTWCRYRKDEDFCDVIRKVDDVIYHQKFTGAAADLLNPNIIARDLGLKDNVSREVSGPDGGPQSHVIIQPSDDPKEASRMYKELMKKD